MHHPDDTPGPTEPGTSANPFLDDLTAAPAAAGGGINISVSPAIGSAASTGGDSDDGGFSVWEIIGISVGAVFGFSIVAGIIYYLSQQ